MNIYNYPNKIFLYLKKMGFLFSCQSNNNTPFFGLEDEKIENNTELGLKVYICGDLPEKNKLINDIFNKKISDKTLFEKANQEFKTDQFYWIARIFPNLSNQTIDLIKEEIQKDFDSTPQIEQNIILCFGTENIEKLFSEINNNGKIYFPFIIVISKDKLDLEELEFNDPRKIINILLNQETEKKLNNIIISQLWECDCYYNEKGNKICRYTPDNIFKNLYCNLSFYSINILLTGKSRAGKSTFLNYINNKLIALESCKKTSATKKITEYNIYINNNYENYSIKFFDTPGIIPGKIEESKQFLNNLLNNENNNLEQKIHFILFFFMEGEPFEGINDILEILDNCNIPVLFIINKAFDESDNGKTKDIKSSISFMTQANIKNLIDENNFIPINLVKNNKVNDFGVENIFGRIYTIFKEKNKINENFNEEIKNLLKKFENINDKPLEMYNKEIDLFNYSEELKTLKNKLDNEIYMFRDVNIDNIIKTGEKLVNKCRNMINSLGNLSQVLNSVDNTIPAISFFQAFMVKEIGEIFGFDLNDLDKEVKEYFNIIKNSIENMDVYMYYNRKKTKEINMKVNMDIIEKELKEEMEKTNKQFITDLAKLFHNLKEKQHNNIPKNKIDKIITDGICVECRDFLKNKLKSSEGLIFWKNYLNICKKLEGNLKKLKSKNNVWGKKEMKIIKK